MKQCYQCKQIFEFIYFHKDILKKDGYYPICKDCRRVRMGFKKRNPIILGYYKGLAIKSSWEYPMLTINNKTIRAHRYIMEDTLGRKLKKDEDVHHIDGDPDNFSPNNLIVLNKYKHRGEHSRLLIPLKEKKVHQILNNKIIATFDSIKKASLYTGANNISVCISGKQKTSKGYKWAFA